MEETKVDDVLHDPVAVLPVEDAQSENGCKKLTDNLYIYNSQPLKIGGRVYKGKQKIAKGWREVAVKLVPYDEKNWKEVELILKFVKHHYVIQIYDAGVVDDIIPHMYIVMELCSQSLRDYIDKNKSSPVDFDNAFKFTKQIFEAISFIHGKEILHRDIKLANILLLSPNGPIKIADFGLSKELKESTSKTTCSVKGLGSDGYIAPELYESNAKASLYSDVFALGVMTYEIFTNGKHPFGSDELRWRTNIIDNKNRDYFALKQFEEPHTSKRAQLVELLDMCLRHEANKRPRVENLLQHPFFSDYGKTTSTTKNYMIAKNIALNGGKVETSDQGCHDEIHVKFTETKPNKASTTSRILYFVPIIVGLIAVAAAVWMEYFKAKSFCPPLNEITHGNINCDNEPEGDANVCRFSCDEGYSLKGRDNAECEEGIWTNTVPACVRTCPPLPQILGGNVDCSDDFYVNSTCKYSCKNDLQELQGPPSLKCLDDGNWSDSPPQCKCIDPCSFGENCSLRSKWSEVVSDVEQATAFNPVTVYYAGNAITCSVSPRPSGIELKWRGKCRDNKHREEDSAGKYLKPGTSTRKAATHLVKKMISKKLYPPPCDPKNLDALY